MKFMLRFKKMNFSLHVARLNVLRTYVRSTVVALLFFTRLEDAGRRYGFRGEKKISEAEFDVDKVLYNRVEVVSTE